MFFTGSVGSAVDIPHGHENCTEAAIAATVYSGPDALPITVAQLDSLNVPFLESLHRDVVSH